MRLNLRCDSLHKEMDRVDAAVRTEAHTQGEEALRGEGTAVGESLRVGGEVGEDGLEAGEVLGVFLVEGTVAVEDALVEGGVDGSEGGGGSDEGWHAAGCEYFRC